MIRRNEPCSQTGTAVAGTIAAPNPSIASEASRRTPSTSAWGAERDVGRRRGSVEHAPEGGAGRGEQQGDVVEVGQMDQIVRGERMGLVGEQEQVLGEQRLDDELGVVHRQVDHGGVQLAGQHARDQRRRRAVLDDRPHVGVLLLQQAEELRHQPARGRADHADAALPRHRSNRGWPCRR